MASGTFAVTTSNQYIVGSLAWWTGTADITGNWTDVYWEWRAVLLLAEFRQQD